MTNYVVLYLDTLQPQNPSITIEGDAVYVANQLINISVNCDDVDKTGYSMLIYGDVDTTHDSAIQTLEAGSTWIPYSATKQVKLSGTDGSKRLYVKLRDDVHNASAVVFDDVNLDQNLPTITVSSLDVSKVSKIAGKNSASFTFSANENFQQFKVKRVSATSAAENTGSLIPTTNGSINTSGTAGYTSGQVITVTINGADLELAGGVQGENFIKIFIMEEITNRWSV